MPVPVSPLSPLRPTGMPKVNFRSPSPSASTAAVASPTVVASLFATLLPLSKDPLQVFQLEHQKRLYCHELNWFNSKTAADVVPLFVTEALVPGLPVVVLPTSTVAAAPPSPASPLSPFWPTGIPKVNFKSPLRSCSTTTVASPGTHHHCWERCCRGCGDPASPGGGPSGLGLQLCPGSLPADLPVALHLRSKRTGQGESRHGQFELAVLALVASAGIPVPLPTRFSVNPFSSSNGRKLCESPSHRDNWVFLCLLFRDSTPSTPGNYRAVIWSWASFNSWSIYSCHDSNSLSCPAVRRLPDW